MDDSSEKLENSNGKTVIIALNLDGKHSIMFFVGHAGSD